MKMRYILSISIVFFISLNCTVVLCQQPEKRHKGNGAKSKNVSNAAIQHINVIPGSPTMHSIMLNILSPFSASAIIEYATDSAAFSQHSAPFTLYAQQPFELLIGKLKEATRYYYRIKYQKEGDARQTITQIASFSTQAPPGKTFVFGVQGDSHPERAGKMFNGELYNQTIDSVSACNPDFYFMLGDDFSLDRLMNSNTLDKESVENIYRIQRKYWGDMGRNPTMFLVNGNHEQSAKYLLNGSPDNFAVYAANARKKYFSLPDTSGIYTGNTTPVQHIGLLKDYYAFEWGDALFVVIDPYWHSNIAVDNIPGEQKHDKQRQLWDITLGDDQYYWLKKTLEKSKAKFKFVFAHHVLGTGRGGVERAKYFEWGGYNQQQVWEFNRYRPNWEMPIHQLFVKNNVTIFFQGHDHLFAHQELDGVIYQSVPNPADDTYSAFNAAAYLSGKILPNAGFLRIKVNPEKVSVGYVQVRLPDSTGPLPAQYEYSIYPKK